MTTPPPLTDAERNAARAYLQRCEVRISTQHRVATAFIGGAGLLLLIPIFLRDIVDGILAFLIAEISIIYPALAAPWDVVLSAVFFACVGYVFVLSLVIPLLGVYWLVEDLVHFYFTVYAPGFGQNLLNPTLALGGINFSPDESRSIKEQVMRRQYQPDSIGFLMPFSEGRREQYFDRLIEETDGQILPSGRDLHALTEAGIIGADAASQRQAQHFNAAMGLARSIDRQLSEEVALSEMHLARNTIYLRRMLLRYVKTLLMFLWTTVVSFLMLPWLEDPRLPGLTVLAVGFGVWALMVWSFMRRPVRWIYRHRVDDPEPRHVDAQLVKMESRLLRWVRVGQGLAGLAVVLALFLRG
ncbi:MAG: hypothetical protein MUC99_04080 [Anaerolineae bacterium]|jgi:hypothetical protein|nr:hypothetical protein [Anaerolineae bacterium]